MFPLTSLPEKGRLRAGLAVEGNLEDSTWRGCGSHIHTGCSWNAVGMTEERKLWGVVRKEGGRRNRNNPRPQIPEKVQETGNQSQEGKSTFAPLWKGEEGEPAGRGQKLPWLRDKSFESSQPSSPGTRRRGCPLRVGTEEKAWIVYCEEFESELTGFLLGLRKPFCDDWICMCHFRNSHLHFDGRESKMPNPAPTSLQPPPEVAMNWVLFWEIQMVVLQLWLAFQAPGSPSKEGQG